MATYQTYDMHTKEHTVIFSKEHGFQQQMITLRNSGGMAGKAYQKTGEMRTVVELSGKPNRVMSLPLVKPSLLIQSTAR
jgi:hypothetical protein